MTVHIPAEKEIGGKNFRVKKYGVERQLELKARILAALGPAAKKLPDVFAARRRDDATSEEMAKADGEAVAGLIAIFTEGEERNKQIVKLLGDIVRMAEIQGASGTWVPVSIERDVDAFGDDALMRFYELAFFVLQEQFAGFFSGVMAFLSRIGMVARTQTPTDTD